MNETAAAAPGVLELIRVGASLALVAALIVLCGWAMRRANAGRRRGLLAVEERVPLARGVQLVVVSAQGRRLVLGVAEKHVSLLTELDEPEGADGAVPLADASEAPPPAATMISRWRRRG